MSAEHSRRYPTKIRFFKAALSVHRWTGLVLGTQLLFWILGGFIMAVLPLEKVHGKHLAQAPKKHQAIEKHSYSLDSLIQKQHENIENIEITYAANTPVYVVSTSAGSIVYNAITGKKQIPLTEDKIKLLAKSYYLKEADISRTELHYFPPHEASRAKSSVWQIDFDDAWSTSLYLDPLTGNLMNTRSTMWRFFDFVWMLHIMDYDTRDDINNPILITFSFVATLFTLSGFVLLYQRFKPRTRRASARQTA